MNQRDRELLSRISKVNASSGEIMLHVLTGIADDDALSADFTRIGQLYSQLGAAFAERASELSEQSTRELSP